MQELLLKLAPVATLMVAALAVAYFRRRAMQARVDTLKESIQRRKAEREHDADSQSLIDIRKYLRDRNVLDDEGDG